jgi:microcystin-dependent protein
MLEYPLISGEDQPETIKNTINVIFPIGSIQITAGANPATYLEDTAWQKIAQGKTLFGDDSSDSDFNPVGSTGGEKEHTLTEAEMPSHTHSSDDYAHDHVVDDDTHSHYAQDSDHSHSGSTNTDYHQHSIKGQQFDDYGLAGPGSGGSITLVSSHGNVWFPESATTSGTHSHTVNISGGTHNHAIDDATHSHNIQEDTHSHTIGDTGSGNSHNNLPPYLVVSIWQRIS